MQSLMSNRPVTVTPGARTDKDRYGRILRYIDTDDGVDVGLAEIEAGLAVARYDSRDGYGHHPREERCVAADTGAAGQCVYGTPPPAAPTAPSTTTPSGGSVYYANCTAARAAGAAPLHVGDPGYRKGLDRDSDGIACE